MAAWSNLIIISEKPSKVWEISYSLGNVRNKVIIDLSSNCQEIDESLVSTSSAITSITGSQYVVSAFSLVGSETLVLSMFAGKSYQFLISSSSLKAKLVVEIMLREYGINSIYDFGDSTTFSLFT